MTSTAETFTDLASLQAYITEQKVGGICVFRQNMKAYPGMGFQASILFDISKDLIQLDLEWISYGLDLFGENLLHNYLYKFPSIKVLTDYIEQRYQIPISAISRDLKFDQEQFPNPIRNKSEKALFTTSWNRFVKDFKAEKFLDSELNLVYDTHDH